MFSSWVVPAQSALPLCENSSSARKAIRVVESEEIRWPLVHREDLAHLYALALERAPARSSCIGAAIDGLAVGRIARAFAKRTPHQEPDIISVAEISGRTRGVGEGLRVRPAAEQREGDGRSRLEPTASGSGAGNRAAAMMASHTTKSPLVSGPSSNCAKFWKIWSGRRDSNPRPRPWQGRALPLSYTRIREIGGTARRQRAELCQMPPANATAAAGYAPAIGCRNQPENYRNARQTPVSACFAENPAGWPRWRAAIRAGG